MQKRHILTVHNGYLNQITTPAESLSKSAGGIWTVDRAAGQPHLAGGAGSASRSQHLGTGQAGAPAPEVLALLDQEQFALLESDPDEPLLILGGAGCGKTTVALHRLAALAYRIPERFDPTTMIVIVPETGLVRLSRKLLDSLGLEKVEVITFSHWIRRQANFLVRGLPRRVWDETPANVVRYKRHPAIRAAFSELSEVSKLKS